MLFLSKHMGDIGHARWLDEMLSNLPRRLTEPSNRNKSDFVCPCNSVESIYVWANIRDPEFPLLQ